MSDDTDRARAVRERRDAGPHDHEIEAALSWVRQQCDSPETLGSTLDHWCALAAVTEWYFTHRDAVAALAAWDDARQGIRDTFRRGVSVQRIDEARERCDEAERALLDVLDARRAGEQGGQP